MTEAETDAEASPGADPRARGPERLPLRFRGFPGAVLIVAEDGMVVDSNGRLEAALGEAVCGRPLGDLLDADSSLGKWERMLATDGPVEATVVELVLRGRATLSAPRRLSVLPDAGERTLWLVEHVPDPRLTALGEHLASVNSELAGTQRELVKEQRLLSSALADLEARSRELERSNEALDDFAHVISHDLKAPLRNIEHLARWIEEDAGAGSLGEESRRHLARIHGRVTRMRALIDGVLALARAGRSGAPRQRVDTDAMAAEVLELLGPFPDADVSVEGTLPAVTAPRAALQQVFLNLVGNAVKFARYGPAPRVRIRGRREGGAAVFEVQDNGPGIDVEQQDRIWRPFHTAEAEDRAEGTGVGLALVRKLVEMNGGSVAVDSVPGRGATFRFTWPEEPRDDTA